MNILITGAASPVAQMAIAALKDAHTIRAIDTADGDLRNAAYAASVLDGIDAILHFAPISLTLGTDEDNLDLAARSTYHLAYTAAQKGVSRMILGSTLKLFDALPANYKVAPSWRPHPQAQIDHLCARMAELTLRECVRDLSRQTQFHGICVRFGEVDQAAMTEVIQRALAYQEDHWAIFHAGQRPMLHTPRPTPFAPRSTSHVPRNIVVFGSGGPLASATARELAQNSGYVLRQTDVRPLADILRDNKPQSIGAPMPVLLDAPHEERVVDVTDYAQVHAACDGMDVIINCTVIRHDRDQTFRVNLIGAFNVMRAALAHGIRRVVHTGPFMLGQKSAPGYFWDDYLVDDVPPRPGDGMGNYLLTKLLGQEVCRIYAEQFQMEVPTLAFASFVNPDLPASGDLHGLSISWADSARAMRCAVEVPTLPSPYEYIHVGTDLPNGVFPNAKAKRVLGWQPLDDLSQWWKE